MERKENPKKDKWYEPWLLELTGPPWRGPIPVELGECPYGQLVWDDQHTAEALRSVFDYVTSEVDTVRDWFIRKRHVAYSWGKRLRLVAITAMAAAGVIPLLTEVWPSVRPIGASLAVALAGFCFLLDRQFDLSNGVARHTKTILALTEELLNFKADWEAERLSLSSGKSDALTFLRKAKATLNNTLEHVQAEASEWLATRQATMKDMEERLAVLEGRLGAGN